MRPSPVRSLLARSPMRRIHKGQEPESLQKYREQLASPPPDGSWERFTSKDDARHSVRREQRQRCAFCQGSIEDKKRPIKLAHVIPQRGTSDGARLQLTWTNIVGACDGGESAARPKLLHCDSLQGKTPLVPQLDPVQFVNGSLHYDPSEGTIHSSVSAVEEQLVNVLGLNRKPVSRKRLDALLGADGIKSLVESSPDPERQRRELIDQLDPEKPSDQPLLEYADFLLWCLRNWALVEAC